MRDIMELKNMDTSDIWRELFIPVDWDARKCYNSVKIEFVGEKYRTWQMYAYISKTSHGEVEIEFTCIYNHDENYMFKKTYTVDTFEELIAYTDKIFKLGPDKVDSISDEMVKTFKNSFDRLLK